MQLIRCQQCGNFFVSDVTWCPRCGVAPRNFVPGTMLAVVISLTAALALLGVVVSVVN